MLLCCNDDKEVEIEGMMGSRGLLGLFGKIIKGLLVLVLLGLVAFLSMFFISDGFDRVEVQDIYELEPPPHAMNVLFIGNSHLFTYSVPTQMQRLCEASPQRPLGFRSSLAPGSRLKWHATDEYSRDAIRSGPWDAIVLQGASLEPFESENGRDYKRAIQELSELAREHGSERVVVMQTWARHDSDDSYENEHNFFERTYEEQQARLVAQTDVAARAASVDVARVGERWASARRAYDKNALYSDTNHASVAGAFLAACVIAEELEPGCCSKSTWAPNGIKDPETLRQIALGTYKDAPAKDAPAK